MRTSLGVVVCVLAAFTSTTASADITVRSEVTLNSPGHLLDAGTFTFKGTIDNNATWQVPSWDGTGTWRQVAYSTSSLTISGTGTVYDGTYGLSAINSSIGLTTHSTVADLSYDSLAIPHFDWTYWKNGTRELRFGVRHHGAAQDATVGSKIKLSDINDHYSSTISSGILDHHIGPDFPKVENNTSWVNSSFSAVPEPSSAAAVGLLGLGVMLRRRRREQKA